MNEYVKSIEQLFNEKGLRFLTSENEKCYSFFVPIGLSNIPSANVVLEVSDSGKCSAYSTIISKVDATIQKELFFKLNSANNNIAFTSFSFDRDDDLVASMNFLLDSHNPGQMAMEYLMLFFKILDDVAPDLLSSIWALRKEAELSSSDISIDEDADEDDFYDESDEDFFDYDDDSFEEDEDFEDCEDDFEFEFLNAQEESSTPKSDDIVPPWIKIKEAYDEVQQEKSSKSSDSDEDDDGSFDELFTSKRAAS